MADDATQPYYEWQCPAQMTPEDRRLGWLNESTEEGQAWLKSQRGYRDFRKSLDVISGRDTSISTAEYRSHLNTNRLKTNVRTVIGALANLRPMWGYHSDNKAYASQAEMFNKVTKAWYLESMADTKVREALQYAAATCRGWIHPIYRRDMFGTGRGDIQLQTFGSPCVLPVQLPSSGDWQSAYVVTILDEMPVAMAHGMYPLYQHRLRPTSSRYWYASDGVRRAAQGNWINRAFGQMRRSSGDQPAQSDLYVPMRKTYVIDLSVNTTGVPIPMGEPGSSWAYTVPFLEQDILVGVDPKSGTPIHRKADVNDCRLYPGRRLLISSDQCICYDGPAFDWHGMLPLVSFCVDDWPWEPLGFSLVHDGFEINEAIKRLERGNMDKAMAQIKPSLGYDLNAVNMKEARAFDPFMPDARIAFDGGATQGAPFQSPIPPEYLKITAESMALIEHFELALDAQLAVNQAQALAKTRTVGSMDELEKIMEANGPIIESISRGMEPPMRDLGIMVKYLIMQYYTTSRVMQYVGADGITPVVFDYDPSSLVPSHLPGEDPERDSLTDARKRARTFADNLRFFILPHSLHEMTQMVMKLGLIQLKKAGVMISSQTIAEAWNVPNYGSLDGNTEIDKWRSEQEMQLEFAARMQMLGADLGLTPPGGVAPGKPTPEGRPPSGQAAPKIQQKDGNTRSTITESK